MSTLQDEAERRADSDAPNEGTEREDAASEEDASPTTDDLPAPDSLDDAVLRWGRYVVEHLRPEPGDVLLIKGPYGEAAAEKREKMAAALHAFLQDLGITDYRIIRGPAQELSIHQISDEQMRELGYVPREEAGSPTDALSDVSADA